MNKAESLKALKKWGFNTPEFKVVQPGRYFTELPSQDYEFFSVRTCMPSGKAFSCPFIRNTAGHDIPDHVNRLSRNGYIVIISSWYPKEWSVCSIHVQMDSPESGLIEYMDGPSIVRDLMYSKEFKSVSFRSLETVPAKFTQVIQACSDIFLFYMKPCIIEISIMDRAVGVQNDSIVFWEVRDA